MHLWEGVCINVPETLEEPLSRQEGSHGNRAEVGGPFHCVLRRYVFRQGPSCPEPLELLRHWVCVCWMVELACLGQILLSSSTFSASLPPSELLPSSSSPLRTCQVSCCMTINPCGWRTISHKFNRTTESYHIPFKLHENLTRYMSRVEGH